MASPLANRSKDQIRSSLRTSTLDGIFATVFSTITGGVLLSNFLVELGATPFQIGLLASIPMIVNLLQPLGAFLADRTTSRRRYNLWVYSISRLLWLPLAGAILIDGGQQSQFLIGATLAVMLLTHVIGAMGSASWLAWIATLVPRQLRGRYFGLRNSAFSLTGLIGLPLLGVTVSQWPGGSIQGFGVMVGIGVVAGLISLGFQSQMVDVNPQDGLLGSQLLPVLPDSATALDLGQPFDSAAEPIVEPSAKPEIQEPDNQEPDNQEPDNQEPDNQEPNSQNLDSQKLDSQKLDSQNLDSQNLDSQKPDDREPDSQKLDSQKPDDREPNSREPNSREPNSREPNSRELDSQKPDSQNYHPQLHFLIFLLYFGLWAFGINLSNPFFNLYLLDNLALDLNWVTLYNCLGAGANLLMLLLWGRLADRIGNRLILLLDGILVAVVPLLWLGTDTGPLSVWLWFPLLHLLGGGTGAAIDLCINNLQFAVVPLQNPSKYFAITAALGGVAGALGSLTGGWLAQLPQTGNITGLFALSSMLRLVALLPLVWLQEPQRRSLKDLWQGWLTQIRPQIPEAQPETAPAAPLPSQPQD